MNSEVENCSSEDTYIHTEFVVIIMVLTLAKINALISCNKVISESCVESQVWIQGKNVTDL